jgi:hypothetical protein
MSTFTASVGTQRKLPRRNLPYTLLVLAIMLGLIALILSLSGRLAMAKESDLKVFAGSVQRAPRWVNTRGGPIIVIRVKVDDGLHDLVVEDFSHSRAIMKLRPDDQVTALVKSFLGQYDVWELRRDGVTTESYQDTYLYRSRENERATTNALWFGLAASILLTVAIALRMYSGVWRESTASVPADAAGSVQGAPHYQPLSSADYPRTYCMSWGREALGLLGAFVAISIGFSRFRSATADVGPKVWGILFIIVGIISILRDLKYRVVLFADRIEVYNLASTQVLRRDEILGRRLVQFRGARSLRLMPQDGQRPLRVLLVLKTDSAFWDWMEPIPDLDAQDAL